MPTLLKLTGLKSYTNTKLRSVQITKGQIIALDDERMAEALKELQHASMSDGIAIPYFTEVETGTPDHNFCTSPQTSEQTARLGGDARDDGVENQRPPAAGAVMAPKRAAVRQRG